MRITDDLTALPPHMAEEIVIPHARRRLSRRDALRRLALFGLGTFAGSALLAGCRSQPVHVRASNAALPKAPNNAMPTGFPGPDNRTIQGVWAPASSPRGAVLIVHGALGLSDHIGSVATRFSQAGYCALALDLLSPEGGSRVLGEDAIPDALGKVPRGRFIADIRAGLDELATRSPNVKQGVVGFCFGGALTWQLLTTDARIAAAVPFYGPLPRDPDFSHSEAAVLAIYAAEDDYANASRDAAKATLEKYALTHQIITYPNTQHAFFDESYEAYDADAAALAWSSVLEWFGTYLA